MIGKKWRRIGTFAKRATTYAAKIALPVAVLGGVFWLGTLVGNGSIRAHEFASENKGLPAKLDYSSVNKVYDALKQKYDGKLDETKLLDGMKSGLTQAAGDTYTEYFDAKAAQSFSDELAGKFSGIGAVLGKDSNGNLIIISPIAGAPASKAGLRPQDTIARIDGQDTSGMSIDAAANKIRGPKNTKVTLKILRNSQELTITVTRDDVTLPSVDHKILDGNIGYLQINQFSSDTADLAQQAAQDFKDHQVKGIVLDLRGNPGGALDAAIDVTSLWLPEGDIILQQKRGATVIETDTATGNMLLAGIPTAVLIDQGSASAAEITAGALRDHHVATLFGEKSFGKGSVQQVIPLTGGTEMKVTIARWYRPNGQNIDKKGITPDHEVKITDSDINTGKDPQKDAAIQFLTNN